MREGGVELTGMELGTDEEQIRHVRAPMTRARANNQASFFRGPLVGIHTTHDGSDVFECNTDPDWVLLD